ncbi:MAG: hypothetical protein RIR77_940 [Planctomycetota bacterium]|jgi:hypothetical protein
MNAKKWTKLKQRMSPDAQARVDARVAKTLAALPLPEMRKAIGLTQQDLAARESRIWSFEDVMRREG